MQNHITDNLLLSLKEMIIFSLSLSAKELKIVTLSTSTESEYVAMCFTVLGIVYLRHIPSGTRLSVIWSLIKCRKHINILTI